MPASYASGPDDTPPLSPREKRILAKIEDDLRNSDPEFTMRMTATATRLGRPSAADGYGNAAASILLFLVLSAVLPPSGRAVLWLVLTLVVLPWLLLRRPKHDNSE